jgi:beta-phosphoglucomutase-like phosphatase (HAD superfamily)
LARRNKYEIIESVIFDGVDGTLVDSVNLHAKAWQVAFEKFDKEVSFEAIRRQIGKGADQLLPVFFSLTNAPC